MCCGRKQPLSGEQFSTDWCYRLVLNIQKYWSSLLILNSSAFSTNRAVPSAEQVLIEDSGSIEMLNSVAVCVGGVVSKLCVMKEVTGSSPAGCGVFFF